MSRVQAIIVTVVVCALCFKQSTPISFSEQRTDQEVLKELDDGMGVLESNITEMWDEINDAAPRVRSASNEHSPRDCADLYDKGNRVSRDYTIYVGRNKRPLRVYCDMTTDGGGWTVFQRRIDGHTNFFQSWNYYVNGFGSVTTEYWLGLKNIHLLTLQSKYTLRVDLSDFTNARRFAEYTDFKIGGACEKYKLLSVGAYCGNAGDSLTYHVGSHFSTLDQDNDFNRGHCATHHKGAWWYNGCHRSNLNGVYLRGPFSSDADGVVWADWLGYRYSLKTTELKIRPADFNL